jgi:two-component system KDP operon response regulator KdpE
MRTEMTRDCNLRKPCAKKRDRVPERETAEGSVSLSEMIESGDFKIDLAARTVTLRGEDLPLTSEEFDVLVFLARHPKRMVTPHTVLATRWDASGLRQTEFLRALVSLRKKLDAAGHGKHYLRTEPWVIYRFDPTSSSAA